MVRGVAWRWGMRGRMKDEGRRGRKEEEEEEMGVVKKERKKKKKGGWTVGEMRHTRTVGETHEQTRFDLR